MQKQLSWLLITILALSTGLAACSGSQATPPTGPDAATSGEEVTEAGAEEAGAEAGIQATAAPAQEESDEGHAADAPQETASEAAAEAGEAAPAAEAPGADDLLPQVETQSETAAAADLPGQQFGLVVSQLNDRGFNDLAWAGMQRAAEELDVAVRFDQDTNPGTVPARINQFINQGYEGVITVGFEMAQATKSAAEANPDVPMAIVDFPSQAENVRGLLFDVDAPAFMAGYLAAGMSQTGTVCTYGGQKIPPVLIFMVGFEHGVEYYNAQNDADVTMLGWRTDPSLGSGGEGVFATNFTNQTFGRIIAEELALQGCDIIFPVAGAVGLGTAEVAANNGLTLIGVDADQALSNPQYVDLYLTSVIKHVDQVVFKTISEMAAGDFVGGNNYIGLLADGDVGLAPFYSFEDQVPQALKDELAAIEQGLNDGSLSTGWPIGASQIETSATRGSLGLVALRNATYQVEYTEDGTVPLQNGQYEESTGDDPTMAVEVSLADYVAYGDVTGDDQAEAAVVLVSNPGGSGVFYELVVMADQNGTPSQIGSVFLGDRIQLKSLAIEEELVQVVMVTQGLDDAQCCPTQQVVKFFGIEDGQLVELSSQVVGAVAAAPPAPEAEPDSAAPEEAAPPEEAEAEPGVEEPAAEEPAEEEPAAPGLAEQPEPASLADIQGLWQLADLERGQPPLPDTEITAEFFDGQVRGFAGCNRYLAPVAAAEDSPVLSVGPVVNFQKACPDPILSQETVYLSRLENVTGAGLLAGQLILTYDIDGTAGQLVFAPQD